jgi:hypothetical protein
VNETLPVSPTCKYVSAVSDKRPLADTLTLYGPPGLKPAALYLPLSAVTLVTVLFVGTCVISTVAPPTASPPDETTPEISDVNSWENANGEMKRERRNLLEVFYLK